MRIINVTQETQDVRTFRLEPLPEFSTNWRPGQYVAVNFPDHPRTRRYYSISSSPLDGKFLEITVRQPSRQTPHIYFEGRIGALLQVEPPTGKFTLPEPLPARLVFLAGGSGVTVFRGMTRYALQQQQPTHITLVYSVRRPHDIIFREEFDRLDALEPRFKLIVTCTRCTNVDEWTGLRGRINANLLRTVATNLSETYFLSSGGREFVKAMGQMVANLGVPRERNIFEDWG